MGLFTTHKSYLGIDIGGSTIKMVELEKKGAKVYLDNYASTYSNVKSDPLIEGRESFLKMSAGDLSRILQEVFKATAFKSKKAAFSIPIHSTFTTILRLPAELEGEELNNAIRYEAKKHVPIPISETVLEWRVIRETQKTQQKSEVLRGSNKGAVVQEVFLMAVPQDVVKRYQSLTNLIDVEPEVLEVEVFSLFRASGVGGKGHYIFIDIGGQNTNITIFSEGFIKDTFNINISGDDFTRAILHERRTLSFDQAEKLKTKEGLNSPLVKEALMPYLEDLSDRIQRRQPVDFQPDGIILAGGAILLKGLVEFFEKKFKVKIEVINPWKNIIVPSVLKQKLISEGPSFAVAVGLALRGLEE